MRYDELRFELHGYLSAEEAVAVRLRLLELPGWPDIHEPPAGPVVIERAEVQFPNGWTLSILRGMVSAGARADLETCRLGRRKLDPIKHATIESVQAELDAVAALPPIARS